MECITSYGVKWLGICFYFPLIWHIAPVYQHFYKRDVLEEEFFWQGIKKDFGYYKKSEPRHSSYNLINLHSTPVIS
jgi:hypothetical protein